jgi:hypothetical protein
MIASKDMYFVQPRYERSPEMPSGFFEFFCIILAIISLIVSIYYFLLDAADIMFMFSSGQILMAIAFIIIGLVKHLCQVMWIVKFFITEPMIVDIGKFICAGAILLLGGALAMFIVMLLSEQKTWIEVLMHPFVVEYGVFLIADIFLTMNFFKLAAQYYVPAYTYATIPQMKPVMTQNYPYAFSLYP